MTKGKTKDGYFGIEKEQVTDICSKIQGFKIKDKALLAASW